MGDVRLTEGERWSVRRIGAQGASRGISPALDELAYATVEAILAARLAAVEALADEWEADTHVIGAPGWMIRDGFVQRLRATIAAQPPASEASDSAGGRT